ncbi:MAG: DUF2203 domain-containing protein [Longimicrobiales bacterium]
MPRKAFTIEEANALIPRMERVFQQLRESLEKVRSETDRVKILDVMWGDAVQDPHNPDHGEYVGHNAAIRDVFHDIERIIQGEIAGRGIRFPSGGLEQGLLDFPTTFRGRWVYLCWRRGERNITAWHEVDGGFAGRRPVTADLARRMGREDDPSLLDDSMLDF